jgi:hypothetical protein
MKAMPNQSAPAFFPDFASAHDLIIVVPMMATVVPVAL